MTKSTITREQAQKIIVAADEVITALAGNNEDVHPDDSKKMCDLWDDLNDRYAPPEVVRELARMALAAMDSEPVAYVWDSERKDIDAPGFYRREHHFFAESNVKKWGGEVIPLYRHAQPVPASHLSRICAESYQVVGALAEALSIFNDIGVIKALDNLSAQKLIHNDVLPFSVPEESQPAPVSVPEDVASAIEALKQTLVDCNRYNYCFDAVKCLEDACCAAMRQSGTLTSEDTKQPEPVTTANKLPPNSFTDDELEGMAHGDNPRSNAYRELLAYRRNYPVIPDTWIPVSERMPEKGQAVLVYRPKAHEGGDPDVRVSVYGRHNFDHGFGCYWEPSHWMPLPAAPQEVRHG